jgi:hypothetical protein
VVSEYCCYKHTHTCISSGLSFKNSFSREALLRPRVSAKLSAGKGGAGAYPPLTPTECSYKTQTEYTEQLLEDPGKGKNISVLKNEVSPRSPIP